MRMRRMKTGWSKYLVSANLSCGWCRAVLWAIKERMEQLKAVVRHNTASINKELSGLYMAA
jgi:hypothetical protein